MHELDARRGLRVEAAGPLDLPRQQVADRLVDASASEPVAVDAEPLERLLRQVDPAAAQVLGDVADEVRELEGACRGRWRAPRGRPSAVASSARPRMGSICSPMTAAEPHMYWARSA